MKIKLWLTSVPLVCCPVFHSPGVSWLNNLDDTGRKHKLWRLCVLQTREQCNLLDGYQHSEGNSFLRCRVEKWRWKQHFLPKRCHLSTKIYSITIQTNVDFIFTSLRFSNIINSESLLCVSFSSLFSGYHSLCFPRYITMNTLSQSFEIFSNFLLVLSAVSANSLPCQQIRTLSRRYYYE
jgi:hypothetical protein